MKTRTGSVLLLAALATVLSTPADAALEIRFITDTNGGLAGGQVITNTCSGAGLFLQCTSSDAYFDIQLSSAITNTPGATSAVLGKTLNVTATDQAITSGATVTLQVYAYDFTQPTGPATLIETLTANNAVSQFGTVSSQGFIVLGGGIGNAFNTAGQSTPVANVSCTSAADPGCLAGIFLGTDIESAAVTVANPYAFTNTVTFDPATTGLFNFTSDLTLTAVPEPASVVLMGTMMLGIGAVLRKKFHHSN